MRLAVIWIALALLGASPAFGQGATPVNLRSGTIVTFERPGIFKFTNSSDIALLLTFATNSDLIQKGNFSDEAKAHLVGDALEICEKYSAQLISTILDRFPKIGFTVVGIRIRKQLGERGGLKIYKNWTSVFLLTDKKCGAPIKR